MESEARIASTSGRAKGVSGVPVRSYFLIWELVIQVDSSAYLQYTTCFLYFVACRIYLL